MRVDVSDIFIKRDGTTADSMTKAFFHLMKTFDLSHKDCAEIVGLTRTSITNMGRGKQYTSAETLDKLANHFGYELNIQIVPKEKF